MTRGQIGSWSFRLSPPWNVPDSSDLSVSFAPDGAFSRVAWTKATVSAQGFTITNPRPLPTSDDADASVSWYKPSLSASAPYSISIHPEKLLSTELTLESGPGQGQYAPYDFEEALFAIVLALLLSRRRRTKVEVRETVGSPTRLLCVVVAILATVQFWQDIQSQISELPYKVWAPSYGFQALLPFNTSVFTWIYGSGIGPELFQFATAGSLYLMCWLIPLTCVSGLLRSLTHSDRLSRMPMAVGAAAALTGCSLYLAIRTYGLARAYNFLNSLQVLRLMAGFVIVFGIIGIVAVRKRDVPILLESRDKALLAWATGYAMLVALPQSYLGIHLGFVALIAVPVTYAVLRICGSDAPAEQSREVLDGKKPEEIVGLQQSLANADGRLAELTEELKSLDTEPAGAWQAEQRLLLKREADRLRCWPEEERRLVLSTWH